MLRSLCVIAAVPVALAACATDPRPDAEPSPEAAAALAGFAATGDTEACLSTRQIDQIRPLDEQYWLVETRSNETYLNRVSRRCNGADDAFTFLQYEASVGRLCQGEIVRVIDNSSGLSRGSCALGDYERLTPVEN